VADALGGRPGFVVPAAMRPTVRAESQKFLGRSDIPVTSYQGAATGKLPPVDTVAIDECLPAGSLIDGRRIETYRVGDCRDLREVKVEVCAKAACYRSL
jgi:hypothetical protein